jgi:hypothetical protein
MSTTGGPWPADSWTAIAPFGALIFCVFIDPLEERQKFYPRRPRVAAEARGAALM